LNLQLEERLRLDAVPVAPDLTAVLLRWLANGHGGADYRAALEADLDALAGDVRRADILAAAQVVAQRRAQGQILLPAHRTAESMLLYAMGATGIDPLRARFCRRPDFNGARKVPRWHASWPYEGIPTVQSWQMTAVEIVLRWQGATDLSLTTWLAKDGQFVLDTWTDAFPALEVPQSPATSWFDLAARLALANSLGDQLGLGRIYDGVTGGALPIDHPAFADTRGWPVFMDDVVRWLLDLGTGFTVGDAWGSTQTLRDGEAGALQFLPASSEPRRTLQKFGPLLQPRSVALSEAMLAALVARCLDVDRERTLGFKTVSDATWEHDG